MSSILIKDKNLYFTMDSIILKSFIPEIFLSLSILLQLVFNVRIINNLKFNFPILDKEIFIQTLFVIISLFFLLLNLKIEGFFSNFLFFNDYGTKIIKIIFILISFFALIFIFKSFSIQTLNFFEFFIILLFSILSSFFLISSYDLLSAYLAIEMQALCFYILASFKRNSAFSTEAGLKYFISGAFISCIFLLGASIIYGSLGTLNLNYINLLLSFSFENDFENLKYFIILGSLCIIITLFFKVSAVPFHFWSPDVYEGSPLSSTIIFSILPKIVIFSFLIRWVFAVSNIFFFIKELFLVVGILSVILGTFFSLKQKKIKKLIIYSSIAQIGFPVAALGSGTYSSYVFIFFFLTTYMLTSILVWGNFTIMHNSQKNLNSFFNTNSISLFLSSFSNLFVANKIWSFSFVFIFFSIAGVPPLLGFLSKAFIILGLIEGQQLFTAILLVVISSISVFYYIRIIKIIFFEISSLKKSNNKFMQLVSATIDLETLIFSTFLLLLLLLFIYPAPLLLLSECIAIHLIEI
jgi:proton-translocating NADH-quinone oxidoreductase chain N